jgi:eukaryotic-like serine/threonine-protein kinase
MPVAPDLAGSALDARYELHALIGEGAFGRVYRGLDRRLMRPVAVKVIKPWWAQDSAWVERFEREARLLARISDPGIVQVFDIGESEQGPYYVAELVDGESLAERLERGAISEAQAVSIAERLCRALASAHAQGIVHCDVKPANVLLTRDGRVKVGDFGVARLAGGGTSQSLSATVAGTPRYMAPEQARGRRTTAATDVYSTGVVLYEMLAGAPPFVQGSAVELGLRHVQDEPPPLPAGVSPSLREIVARALRKRPEQRFADAAEMAGALRATGLAEAPHEEVVDGVPPSPSDAGLAPAADTEHAPGGEAATAGGEGWTRGGEAPTQARPRTRLMPRPPAGRAVGAGASGGERRLHGGRRGRRALLVFGCAAALLVLLGWLLARGGGGPARARVPGVVGRQARSAIGLLSHAGLRHKTTYVAGDRASAGTVLAQSPRPGAATRRGATVSLSVAEHPRWRTLTTFAGDGDGRSVPFRIEGRRWRVSYSMSYVGTCTFVLVCFGPSAQPSDLRTGARLEAFDLSSGSSHGHTYDSGPGLYDVVVSRGEDSAHWRMSVQDYY